MRDIIDKLLKGEPSAALPIMAACSLRGMRILHQDDITDAMRDNAITCRLLCLAAEFYPSLKPLTAGIAHSVVSGCAKQSVALAKDFCQALGLVDSAIESVKPHQMYARISVVSAIIDATIRAVVDYQRVTLGLQQELDFPPLKVVLQHLSGVRFKQNTSGWGDPVHNDLRELLDLWQKGGFLRDGVSTTQVNAALAAVARKMFLFLSVGRT